MPHRVRTPDDPTSRLRLAARTGKIHPLQRLLQRDPSYINEAREEDGWTALHLASFWGHVDCVKALLSAGAATDLVDIEGRTALHMACLYGEAQSVRLLLEANADATLMGRASKTALDFAHESGATDCVALLLAHEAAPVEVEIVGECTEAENDMAFNQAVDNTPMASDRGRKRPTTEATAAMVQHAKRRRPVGRRSAGEMPRLEPTVSTMQDGREVIVIN